MSRAVPEDPAVAELAGERNDEPHGGFSLLRLIGILLVVLSLVIYVLLFFRLYPEVGRDVRILTVLPPLVAAGFFGVRWGLGLALACNLVITPLFLLELTDNPLGAIFLDNAVGIVVSCIVAVVIGALRDMYLKIQLLNAEVTQLSRKDYLTGMLNRRALYELADYEFRKTLRLKSDADYYLKVASDGGGDSRHFEYSGNNRVFKQQSDVSDYVGVFACAMIDVDFFKRINDSYGHLVGDEVLKIIAGILCKDGILRSTDIVGRFGGEEFLVIFPNTSARHALIPLMKISEAIRQRVFDAEGQAIGGLTVSCGVSQLQPGDQELDDIINRADNALYYAKENGRNRIVIYEEQCGADAPDAGGVEPV